MPRNKSCPWTDRAEDSTVSLAQAQELFLAHLSEQGFPFPTAVPSLPTESSLLALTLQQRKAPLSLWFCVSLALWSALLCFRVLLLSRVQLLIYQTGTTMSVSQTAQAGRAFPRQPPQPSQGSTAARLQGPSMKNAAVLRTSPGAFTAHIWVLVTAVGQAPRACMCESFPCSFLLSSSG